MAFEVVVRKWGNSLGVVFPKEFVRESRLRTNEKVLVNVVREANLRRVFGALKAKTGGQEFKDMVREEWK
jgi:antitoxin component of MazEF toxin-antitoxin module